ncbi:hypothetical protein [Methylobacterium sp. UNC378MF]|uniref:hypothetical protein n=1 Tax=Methylobacterium sp. UNC378MF TaxID=1502748 RepID=UPI0011144632|nr:hypothetical protein [Methylobacterium sp. UNC378MF]
MIFINSATPSLDQRLQQIVQSTDPPLNTTASFESPRVKNADTKGDPEWRLRQIRLCEYAIGPQDRKAAYRTNCAITLRHEF